MNELIAATSNALLQFVWHGAALAGLLAIALRVIPTTRANLRYLVSVGTMALMLALPLAVVVLDVTAGRGATVESGSAVGTPGDPLVALGLVDDAIASPGGLGAPGGPVWSDAFTPSETLRRTVVTLWFVGVLTLTLINAGGAWQVHRVRRSGRPIDRPGWPARIERLRERLGIDRRVRVLQSVRVDVPTVVGWLRPVVLVPSAALLGISPQALDALILHELAHVRRYDPLVNLLQAAVESLLFYHPAVWWVSRRVRAEREHCCDDVAVRACGDRGAYLTALLDMERLRSTTPRLAVAADGGTLVTRVRRLTATDPNTTRTASARWATGFVTLALVALVGMAQLPWLSPTDARTGAGELPVPAPAPAAAPVPVVASMPMPAPTAPSVPTAPTAPSPAALALPVVGDALDRGEMHADGEMLEGVWRAKAGRNGEVWMQLRRDDRGRFQTSFTAETSAFDGTGEDGIPGFMLRRDAGTFYFEGALDGRERDGRFEFRADPQFASRMRSLGFDGVRGSTRRHFEYAALDVSLQFARDITQAGYGDIGMQRLTEFRIHGVTGEFITAVEQAGYSDLQPQRLVEFRIHGVSAEFVRDMAQAGFDGLTPDRLVEFRIHGITPDYVSDMAQSGFDGLTAQKLVEFRIHGITPDYVTDMAQSGFRDLTPQRLVEFRIHGIDAGYVRAMADAGYRDLPARKLVEFRIHGVTPEWIGEMARLGFDEVPAQKLIEMRIHGVSPEFVREARAEYGDDLSVQELIELRIHGRRWDS